MVNKGYELWKKAGAELGIYDPTIDSILNENTKSKEHDSGERMTDTGSCKTCRYFDSKDWDSEIKNWCRYNDLPVIYAGSCEYYEPMLKPCPFCGHEVETEHDMDVIGSLDARCINCKGCGIHFTVFSQTEDETREAWNRRVKE